MSLLVIQLPPRARLGAQSPAGEAAPRLRLPNRWPCVFSTSGGSPGPLRLVPTAQMPRADRVVLVLAETDVSWHLLRLPRAPASRMRSALAGVLEEQILDEVDEVHMAVAPGAKAGEMASVAVTNRAYLKGALAALDAAGVRVDRVVPALPPPGGPLRGHFLTLDDPDGEVIADKSGMQATFADTLPGAPGGTYWTLVTADGAWTVPLFDGHDERKPGGLALALRDRYVAAQPDQRWTATPSAAKAAQWLLGRGVMVQTPAEHLLEAAESAVNLRQFDLMARNRGLKSWRGFLQGLGSVEWRAPRRALIALLIMNVVGLNAYAVQQRHALESRQLAMTNLLRSTYPSVRTVLDARAQMFAETERLRAAAGKAGPADLEGLMAAAAAAWPEGKTAIRSIRFSSGRLTLSADDWREDEIAAFRQRLEEAGWTVGLEAGALSVTHSPARGVRP